MNNTASDPLEHARALHRQVPLIDGHNDLPWKYHELVNRDISRIDISVEQRQVHTDIPRLRAGGVGGQFWSVYVPASVPGADAVLATMEEIDTVYRLAQRYPETFEIARSAREVEHSFSTGKIASLIGMEGGHSIHNSLAALRMFYALGVRYMTLTHGRSIDWADSATDDERAGGLTEFGREVVREMNRLGMLLDLSHVSPRAMHQALDESRAPIIFSHSNARALCDHPRNVPDDVLRRLPENGGMIMVTFVPHFTSEEARRYSERRDREEARLAEVPGSSGESVEAGLAAWDQANPAPRARLDQVADHIDHIRKIAGIGHIGIGSDFDGIRSVIEGLEDVSKYPNLTAELIRRGYSDTDIFQILGRSLLRVLSRAEAVSRELRAERPPSEARIELMDRR
ncbi:MAG: membrane dipeptidase [Acidobacteria bacterium]|nr:membrane dipeptidase [Acidobacteriota bacterium]